MDVCVLTSPHFEEVGTQLVDKLHHLGLSAELRSSGSSQDSVLKAATARTLAAILDDQNVDQLVCIAHLQGKGSQIILVDPGVQTCPLVLQAIKRVSLNQDTAAKIVEFVRSTTNRSELRPVPENTSDFVNWAAQNIEDIANISSQDFERLISVLLAASGLGKNTPELSDDSDTFFYDVARKSRISVECKRFTQGSNVDIRTVRNSIERALQNECDVAILATNSILTEAAGRFAATCVPPVWHIGLDTITSLLTRVRDGLISSEKAPRPKRLECSAWTQHRHYDLAGSILEMLCVPGSHDVATESWLSRHHSLPEIFYADGSDRPDFFVFFSVTSPEEDHLSALSRPLLEQVVKSGLRVWHNSPHLDIGHHCSELKDFSVAVRKSKAFLIFDNISARRSFDDMKVLTWVASQFLEAGVSRPTIVSGDACRSRLRLPSCFANGLFIDESDWVKASECAQNPQSHDDAGSTLASERIPILKERDK